MGCLSWCGLEKKEKQPTKITSNRSCTDVAFLLFFVFGWVVLFFIFGEARNGGGDPNKIVRGVDMNGNICGISESVKDKPLAAWPYPLAYSEKICVSDCSYTNTLSNNSRMAWLYSSVKFTYYCIPSGGLQNASVSVTFTGNFEQTSQMITRAVGDLFTTWNMILASAAISLAIAYVFTFLLRYIAGVVIWCCIALLVFGGLLLGFTLVEAGNTQGPTQENRAKMLKYAGDIVFAITALFILVIFFLRKEIRIATELVKEAARAMLDMKSIIFFPLIPFALALAYFTFWVICALYIFSVSSLQAQATPSEVLVYGFGFPSSMQGQSNGNPSFTYKFVSNTNFHGLAAALFFHLLWNVQFQFYLGFTVLAGAVANWYFTIRDHKGNKVHGDPEHNELPPDPVTKSFYRTLRFHLGTIALASFIIAVIQFIRAVIFYIEKKAGSNGKAPNALQKCVLGCMSCCLSCVECCLDKVSKNALIWTAIWGDNFFTAACSSFVLLWRNLARVAALNAVSDILMFIGKMTVAVVTMALCGYMMTHLNPWQANLYSPIVPGIVIFMLAYVVASMFMLIFEVAIDTTLICFLVDSEKNHDTPEKMFASNGLKNIVAKHQKESEEIAAEMNTTRQTKLRPEDVAAPEDVNADGNYLGEQHEGERPVELNRYN